MKKFLLIWMLLVTLTICVDKISPALPDVVAKVNPSVVQIKARTENGREWLGSGVIVHEHGLILTARHVIRDANDITIILADGEKYKVVNKIVDPNNDIGIVHITPLKDLPAVKFGGDVKIGEKVFIVGSPFGFRNSVALGIVAGGNRLDITGNPGSSGGPVFNMKGRIVGIVVSGIRNNMVFIVPADTCKRLLEKYE